MFWVNWQKNSFWNHQCQRNHPTATKGDNIIFIFFKIFYNIEKKIDTTLQHYNIGML